MIDSNFTLEELLSELLKRFACHHAKQAGVRLEISFDAGKLSLLFEKDTISDDMLRMYREFYPAGSRKCISVGTYILVPMNNLESALNTCEYFIRDAVNFCGESYKKAMEARVNMNYVTTEIFKIIA